jgi:hypothetical protein
VLLPHSVNSPLIQPHPHMTDDLNAVRVSLGIDDERNHAHPLKFRPPGFIAFAGGMQYFEKRSLLSA